MTGAGDERATIAAPGRAPPRTPDQRPSAARFSAFMPRFQSW